MKTHDTYPKTPRRLRTVPQSSDTWVELTDRDYDFFDELRKFSPLPTPLAFELYQKHEPASYGYFQRRLTQLTNEKMSGGPFLYRPAALNPDYGAKCEPAWYVLSPQGEKLVDPLPIKKDPLHHRGMGACIAVSEEVLGPMRGMTRIHFEDIQKHPKNPNPEARHIPTFKGKYEPDDIMGYHYKNEGFKFFFVEHDRGTEAGPQVKEKLDKLLEIFSRKLHTEYLGLPNARAIFFTSKEARVKEILDYLKGKPHAEKILIKCLPQFGVRKWRAPRALITDIFNPYHSIRGPVDITKP